MRAIVLLCGLALPLLSPAAEAQFAIEQLFSKTEAVTISGHTGCVNSSSISTDAGDCGLYGFGLEALINLAVAKKPGDWGVELALGYGQIAGFRSSEPSLDLRGALRALPSVAAYASRERKLPAGFDEVYLGLHTGLLRLANMHAYDAAGRQYALEGDTFEFGISFGLYNRIGLFIEPTYRIRYFPGVAWTLPSGVSGLPAGWPRSLNLSGPSLAVGYQFSLATDEEEQ